MITLGEYVREVVEKLSDSAFPSNSQAIIDECKCKHRLKMIFINVDLQHQYSYTFIHLSYLIYTRLQMLTFKI
jgi:hypothetical protein